MSRRKHKPHTPTQGQIERACLSKTTYYSLAQAQQVALYKRSVEQVMVYAYGCDYCANWHIGHRYN